MCFSEEDLWNFSQSESIIGLNFHVGFSNEMKIIKNVEDYQNDISTKFSSNWSSGLWGNDCNVKSLKDNIGGKVITIPDMNLLSRWAKNERYNPEYSWNTARYLLSNNRSINRKAPEYCFVSPSIDSLFNPTQYLSCEFHW